MYLTPVMNVAISYFFNFLESAIMSWPKTEYEERDDYDYDYEYDKP